MRRIIAAAAMVALCASWAVVAASPSAATQDAVVVEGELGAALDRYLRGLESFGYSGAALVAREGTVVLRKGYGVADRESGRAATPATVFTTGSITKQFTGAAVVKLEAQGKLSVDDKIIDYFDGVPPDKQEITIHQLLTHSAGFPGAIGDDFGADTRDRFLEQAMNTELLFEPGERYEYSNVGYSLAAIIVEIVSGKDYEEFLIEELFVPAGMTRTGYARPDYADDEVAVGYRGERRWGTFIERDSFVQGPSWHLKGNGGVQSTVGDMYRWHLALAGDEILSAEAKEKYFARHIDEGFGDTWYGYGWVTRETPRGTRLVSHNGGNGVFSADFHRYVDDGVVVYVTSASAEFFIDPISAALAGIVFGEPVGLPPLVMDWGESAADPSILDDYEGTYRLDDDSTIRVRRDGDHLRLAAIGANGRNLLLGGTGGQPNDTVDAITLRTESMVDRWIRGDVGLIHEAMDGDRTLEDLEQALARFRRMREQEYGPLESAVVGNVLPGAGGYRAFVGMRHAERTGWVVFHWEEDRLVAIEPVEDLPRPVSEVYPVRPEEFASFDIRSPVRLRFRFEADEQGAWSLYALSRGVDDEWILGWIRLPRVEAPVPRIESPAGAR